MNRFIPLAAALLALILPVPQVSAEESESAARLRTVTETFLRSVLATPHDEGPGGRLDFRIEMTEHSDGIIAATIRDLVFRDTDFRLVIDDVVVTYSPLDELRYTASMDIPSMNGFDADGTEIGRFTALRWHVECVMHIDLALCESSEMDAADLVLIMPPHHNRDLVLVKLDRFSSTSALHETAAQTWSASADFAFTGLSVTSDGLTQISVGEARLTGEFRGVLDIFLLQRQGTNISPGALWREWLENPARAQDGRLLPIDHVSVSYTLSDLSWNDGAGGGAVGSAKLELSTTALNGNEGGFRLRYRHDRLDVDDVPVMIPNVDPLPVAFGLDLDLEALPVNEFMRIVTEPSGSDPMSAGKPDPDMMMSLLTQAGSTLQFKLDYTGPALIASGTGHFAAAPKEPVPATGQANLVLTGLPDLVRQVRDDAMSGNNAAVEVASFLTLWHAIGRKEETSDGLRHHYDLELPPDGQILLNGNDLDILFDLLGQN